MTFFLKLFYETLKIDNICNDFKDYFAFDKLFPLSPCAMIKI
ncbi:hypothetical protein CDIMF43_170011 [Carnobacterium divergens]|nr:hypothetical protein CDIV41_230163 [Carnobacterium divergens]SPC39741.1 hypothetical protein CDIMF43_170011 [Carnobacterium divergens]